jgi:hypothetical protein
MFPRQSLEPIFPETNSAVLGPRFSVNHSARRRNGDFEQEHTCGYLNKYESKQENKNQVPGTRN